MKKNLLKITTLAVTLALSSFAFAGEPPLPSDLKPAQATVHWTGSVADIIPGDNIIITGSGGSVNVLDGSLNLQKNGTFKSSNIKLESRAYDPIDKIIGDVKGADWILQSVDYVWGENEIGNSNIQVFNTTVGTDDKDALVVGQVMKNLETMSLQVVNSVALDVTDVKDVTADAKVNVTVTALFSV